MRCTVLFVCMKETWTKILGLLKLMRTTLGHLEKFFITLQIFKKIPFFSKNIFFLNLLLDKYTCYM